MDEKEVDFKEENRIDIETSPEPESEPKPEPESEENPSSVSAETEGQKKNRESLKEKQNKQIIWAVVLMVSMIVIIVAVPYLRDNFFNKFNYHGMTFQKTMFGKLEFYNTQLPIFSKSNAANVGTGLVVKEEVPESQKQTGSYELSLRQDPRELDNIKVDLDINNITFIKNKTVYATYNASDPVCEHNVISAADLARFLLNFGDLDAEGAAMNKDYAEENKIPYVTCNNNPGNTVIMIVAGNESKISKIRENCYELMYADCDMLGVTNKFILSLAEGYTNTFVKNNNGLIVVGNKSI